MRSAEGPRKKINSYDLPSDTHYLRRRDRELFAATIVPAKITWATQDVKYRELSPVPTIRAPQREPDAPLGTRHRGSDTEAIRS